MFSRLKQFRLGSTNLPSIYVLPGAVILAIVMFVLGQHYHSLQLNPFTKRVQTIDFSSLNDIYGLMQRNFDGTLDAQKALEGAKSGLVAAGGDPYTVFMNAAATKALNDDLNGKLSGIGAQIGIKNNLLTVIAPIANSPAEAAGLKPGDVIAKINNDDTSGMDVDTAVSKIRGKAGTTVTLKVVRSGIDPKDVMITRADLTVPSVNWSMKTSNIGYIQISVFGSDTSELIKKAASDLKAKGATRIALDLRNNGGGFLDAGITVASQFVPEGKLIVEERNGGVTRDKALAQPGGLLIGLPTVVLMNGGSASASEIVAGALHDNGVATLVGEKSFGKGSVQEIKPLPDGAQLKVTVAHWYTPNGVNINKAGIQPDVEVKLTNDDYNASRDPQLDRALQILK